MVGPGNRAAVSRMEDAMTVRNTTPFKLRLVTWLNQKVRTFDWSTERIIAEYEATHGTQISGTMTPDQYRAALIQLGLSLNKAAVFLNVDERQSRRWANGDAEIPASVAKLLRLMILRKISFSPAQPRKE